MFYCVFHTFLLTYVLCGHIQCVGPQCDDKLCKKTLMLDGNMKNHRDVCTVKEASYAEYEGLPCSIQPKASGHNISLKRTDGGV